MSSNRFNSKIVKSVLRAFVAAAALALPWAFFPPAGSTAQENKAPAFSQDKRFVDNGDQTVTDTKTGLMWTKMDAYQQENHWLNWNEAIAFVERLNKDGYANHFDWRVPAKNELVTLYEENKFNGSQVGHEMNLHMDPIFAKEGAGSLWTVEENGQYNAFGVVFNTGKAFSAPKASKSRKSVRAVRSAKP